MSSAATSFVLPVLPHSQCYFVLVFGVVLLSAATSPPLPFSAAAARVVFWVLPLFRYYLLCLLIRVLLSAAECWWWVSGW